MTRIAIVGGGISGLSAAYYLEKAKRSGAPVEYVLYESAARFGGVIQTAHINGCTIEAGPDSYLTTKPWARELADELGIGDQLIHSNDAQRKTYILNRGHLVVMPQGLQLMVPTEVWPVLTSPLFSLSTKIKMGLEYFTGPSTLPAEQDESVASFVRRHFGEETVDRLASPLLAGIYGGDAAGLSARAVIPAFLEMEARDGSLVKALLKSKAEHRATAQPLFTSFRDGMQQLVDAMVAHLPFASLKPKCAVTRLQQRGRTWIVTSANESVETFSHVILALPSFTAADLLNELSPSAAEELRAISYTSSVTVALEFSRAQVTASGADIPPGFGFLVPRPEGKRIIACTFVHNKFDHRVPPDKYLLRAFLTDSIELSDEELTTLVRKEFSVILGLRTEPLACHVNRCQHAMPQYQVGHLARVACITQLASQLPGSQLIGNAYRGIGIPDCVREGKLAAENIASCLSSSLMIDD